MTVIEPAPQARSDGDGDEGRALWGVPLQRTAPAPAMEGRDEMPAFEPEPHASALKDLWPREVEDDPNASHPAPDPPPQRLQADGLRVVLMLGDSLVLTAFLVGGFANERWVVTASALVMLVALAGRTMSVDRIPALLAVPPVVKTWAIVISPACAAVALSGSADTGRELVFGGLAILAALISVRATLRTSRVGKLLGVATKRRSLLVGDEFTLLPMVNEPDSLPGSDEVVGILPQVLSPANEPGHDDELSVERVVSAARSHGADQVTVVPGGTIGAETLRELSWALEETGIDLAVTTELQGVAPHRVELTQVGDRLQMQVRSAMPRGWAALTKGAVDRLGAATLLTLLSPVLLCLLLAVRLDSPGPAIFRQARVRKGGIEFRMYKFRTMHLNAESALQALLNENDHGDAAVLFKMRHDPRVTRLGQVLRRTSIDELPQLLNVLKGEMSLIGPRPALPSEVAKYDKTARRRLAVKPGMTGLWQVNGRSKLSWKESLRYDLDYVDNWTPGRESVIAVRTVKAVLDNDGAY